MKNRPFATAASAGLAMPAETLELFTVNASTSSVSDESIGLHGVWAVRVNDRSDGDAGRQLGEVPGPRCGS